MCNEKVIPRGTQNTKVHILRALRASVYKNHLNLRKFGEILLTSEVTKQIGVNIINEYSKDHCNVFLLCVCHSDKSFPSSHVTINVNAYDPPGNVDYVHSIMITYYFSGNFT